jgi:hypothetical protein
LVQTSETLGFTFSDGICNPRPADSDPETNCERDANTDKHARTNPDQDCDSHATPSCSDAYGGSGNANSIATTSQPDSDCDSHGNAGPGLEPRGICALHVGFLSAWLQ